MSNPKLRFDGRVAVVTGSGGGLGRCYALLLASRGAKVVVNDVGTTVTGQSQNFATGSRPADLVVAEIRKAGGTAAANYDSVTEGEKIIEFAVKQFGGIDILINNAGILRDVSFRNINEAQWRDVIDVHVNGAMRCAKAAWKYMEKQQYGRIVNASSASGIYGSFGQANYSTAKAGIIGLTSTLSNEGKKRNIFTNAVAPIAGTRMTETVWSKDLVDMMRPEYVAGFVCYLCSEACTGTGDIYEVGANWAGKLRWERTAGCMLPIGHTLEDIHANWAKYGDFTNAVHPKDTLDSYQMVFDMFEEKYKVKSTAEAPTSKASPSSVTLSKAASSLKCAPILSSIVAQIAGPNGAAIAEKASFVYRVDILSAKGAQPVSFTLNLKSSPPTANEGAPAKFDACFTMLDEDFIAIMTRKLNHQVAFMQGRMKIKGNMRAATKFTPSLFAPPSKL
uniref:3-oxoacyl-[acyl-carrier-protein] reductase n=1 Tax=Nephromyces sp. MMRI TaxID=2496275 RepID=A0A3S8V373_9APIC|nr:3-oxoacyl-[acyl-carrier-protein] reductase [Nephromyces sp. MMRI]AZL94536.1 3-oxoacyl-[acyl-carrier-protein] reductase [Nephromyces sp. MMRI]